MGQQQDGSVSHKPPAAAAVHLPFLCPVIFHLRAAAPGVMIFFPFCFHGSNLCMFCWCSPLQALVTLGMAPVELVALLSLVLAEREVGCWMKAPAFSQLRVTAGTGDPAAQGGTRLLRNKVPGLVYFQNNSKPQHQLNVSLLVLMVISVSPKHFPCI